MFNQFNSNSDRAPSHGAQRIATQNKCAPLTCDGPKSNGNRDTQKQTHRLIGFQIQNTEQNTEQIQVNTANILFLDRKRGGMGMGMGIYMQLQRVLISMNFQWDWAWVIGSRPKPKDGPPTTPPSKQPRTDRHSRHDDVVAARYKEAALPHSLHFGAIGGSDGGQTTVHVQG